MSDVRGHYKNVLETALQDVNLVLILSHQQYTSILNYDSGLVLCIYIYSCYASRAVFFLSQCTFSDPSSALFDFIVDNILLIAVCLFAHFRKIPAR